MRLPLSRSQVKRYGGTPPLAVAVTAPLTVAPGVADARLSAPGTTASASGVGAVRAASASGALCCTLARSTRPRIQSSPVVRLGQLAVLGSQKLLVTALTKVCPAPATLPLVSTRTAVVSP